VGGVWLLSSFVFVDPHLKPLEVSTEAAIATGVALSIAIVAAVLQRRKQSKWLTMVVILSLCISILLSLVSTGDMSSPYLALWMLGALFATLVGVTSLLPVALGVAAYGAYLWFYDKATPADWVIFGLTVVFPIVVGWLIWSRRFQAQDKSNQAVSDLAQELNQESNKSEIIINAIADGVILVDGNGLIQLINPAAQRIIGWGSDDATKLDYRSVLKIIDNKDVVVSEQFDPVQQCLKTNQVIITDKFGIRTVSGKQLFASILASPLNQANPGVIIVFRDTTAQQAEEQGQAEFISTASHEMRTPVAAIEGYLGLALNPQTAVIDDKARSFLTKAQEAAHHLGRLFQDLLDISRIEDGRLSSKPTMIDIPSFTRTLLEDFSGQIAEKGLSLTFAPDTATTAGQSIAPIFYTNVDPDHLREVLSNLVTNALKYTKEGTIVVDVTGDDEHVFVSVKDSGIGIPAEDLPHLFQKFYRVDNSDTREIGGTGLGLYLARRLTETMGGHMGVTSVYGEGSTFTIDLPRVSKDTATSAMRASTTPQPQIETKL
jgi:PAS domain S-box-containing protein